MGDRKSTFYLASLRALCIADSIMLPEAECSLGIGTANRTPVLSFSFVFASVKNNNKKMETEIIKKFLKVNEEKD